MCAKKRVFIASSTEAKKKGVYKAIVELIQDDYEIVDWQNVMKQNHCVLDCLIEQSLKVDKAIFIGTADDKVIGLDPSRGEKIQHRDNVIFELGLFMGTLGKENCMYLVEDSTLDTVMSDYTGIIVLPFNIKKKKYPIQDILKNLKLNAPLAQSVFPSVTLGTIYFDNFIQPIINSFVHAGNKLKIEGLGKNYKDFRVIILIPENISSDMNLHTQYILNKCIEHNKQGRIASVGRDRQLNYYVDNKQLFIVDVPSVLSGLRSLLDNILPKSRSCEPDDYESIINREIERFVNIIKLRVADTPYADSIQIECLREGEFPEVVSPAPTRAKGWL